MGDRSVLPLYASVRGHARLAPDKAAVITGGRVITYGQLLARTLGWLDALLRLGTAPEDRVLIDLAPVSDYLAGIMAVHAAGGVAVPLATEHEPAWREVIGQTEPAAFLTARQNAKEVRVIGALCTVVSADERAGGAPSVAALAALARVPQPNETAMILFSSGTTSGQRKGVVQPHRQLEATAVYITEVMGITSDIVEYVASPLDAAFGIGRCRVVLRAGGTVVRDEGIFNPGQLCLSLERDGVNAISGDSPVFGILLEGMVRQWLARFGPRVRWLKMASAPLPEEKKRALLELFPNARQFMNYGLTEAMRSAFNEYSARTDKINAVGRPAPGVEIRVVDDRNRALPAGGIGEVQVRGVNLADTYWRREDLWKERCASGWYATGDMGHFDDEGFLYIVGRADDTINLGGRKVHPAEIEAAVQGLLKDRIFCVTEAPTPGSPIGNTVVLWLEGEETIDFTALRRSLEGRLEPYKIPSRLMTLPEFPRTDNGKIKRRVLRDLVKGRP